MVDSDAKVLIPIAQGCPAPEVVTLEALNATEGLYHELGRAFGQFIAEQTPGAFADALAVELMDERHVRPPKEACGDGGA